ncbi:MAG: translocation/assembly module TamB domain-containing protein [Ignavibacteriales bacterium]|nr:translocation/assembly module TamB domain-containing protein [Ignavibacteriales bacterium]
MLRLTKTPAAFFGTSRYQSEVTGVTAASLLSESLTGVLGQGVERIFGLQSFRVDPFLAGAENDPTARVTISERISKDLTVTFSRNLSTNKEQIVLIEYDISRNYFDCRDRDEKGQFGLDFRLRRRYK